MGARAVAGGGAIQEEGPGSGGGAGGGPAEGASATAAKRMVQAVQQFVAMLQIQQVGEAAEALSAVPWHLHALSLRTAPPPARHVP